LVGKSLDKHMHARGLPLIDYRGGIPQLERHYISTSEAEADRSAGFVSSLHEMVLGLLILATACKVCKPSGSWFELYGANRRGRCD
jgi:hypothetical protein